MAIKHVLRTGLMQLRVLDLDKALKHYVDVIGLDEVCRTSDGRVCLKGYDEFDHHSFTLREADTAGMDFIGFKAESPEALDVIEEKTKAFGFSYKIIEAETDQPGFGKRLAVNTSTGHRFDIYAEVKMGEDIPEIKNPNIWQKPPHGMGTVGLDHALLYGTNAAQTVQYCQEVLGMSLVERLKGPDGKTDACSWLTSNNKAHDIAILEYDKPGKLHHVGFKLESWGDIGRAADLITINDIALDAGPMRHGITRGQTIYFFDPSGNRNEVYAGGYAHYPDMPVREWDFDEVGRGIFYYSRQLNDRYLTVVT